MQPVKCYGVFARCCCFPGAPRSGISTPCRSGPRDLSPPCLGPVALLPALVLVLCVARSHTAAPSQAAGARPALGSRQRGGCRAARGLCPRSCVFWQQFPLLLSVLSTHIWSSEPGLLAAPFTALCLPCDLGVGRCWAQPVPRLCSLSGDWVLPSGLLIAKHQRLRCTLGQCTDHALGAAVGSGHGGERQGKVSGQYWLGCGLGRCWSWAGSSLPGSVGLQAPQVGAREPHVWFINR